MATAHPEKVSELQNRLNKWLAETGATFPARDPRFSLDKFDAKIETARTTRMQKLEKQHADFLETDWTPLGKTPWWGSSE